MSISVAARNALRRAMCKPKLADNFTDAVNTATANAATALATAGTDLKVHAVDGTGTDGAGTDADIEGGQSTGAGNGGDVVLRSNLAAGSTGTTPNGLVDRKRVVARRYPLVTTVAKPLFEVALPAAGMHSLTLSYAVRCSDGTDHQVIAGVVNLALINKAGTYTFTATDSSANLAASGASTLTLSWTKTNGTNKLTINLTATSSLTPTTFDVAFEITSNTGAPVTLL